MPEEVGAGATEAVDALHGVADHGFTVSLDLLQQLVISDGRILKLVPEQGVQPAKAARQIVDGLAQEHVQAGLSGGDHGPADGPGDWISAIGNDGLGCLAGLPGGQGGGHVADCHRLVQAQAGKLGPDHGGLGVLVDDDRAAALPCRPVVGFGQGEAVDRAAMPDACHAQGGPAAGHLAACIYRERDRHAQGRIGPGGNLGGHAGDKDGCFATACPSFQEELGGRAGDGGGLGR